MLEMRHGLNNCLTSVLGNAELLLLEPGTVSGETREQIETIHTMALRMHEVMQRFSSLESEMHFAEKESHSETREFYHVPVSRIDPI
jgi:signal transduction histidine kinase